MTTRTLTLTDFLLARIAEVEAWVQDQSAEHWNEYDPGEPNDPARILAECKAKRSIIEFHKSWPVLVERPIEFDSPVAISDVNSVTFRASQQIMWATEDEYRKKFGMEPPTAPMLRALAAVYAHHRDFNPDWA